jgi:hypothetical protein
MNLTAHVHSAMPGFAIRRPMQHVQASLFLPGDTGTWCVVWHE